MDTSRSSLEVANAHMARVNASRHSQQLIQMKDDPNEPTRCLIYVDQPALSRIILEAYIQGTTLQPLNLFDIPPL